MHSSNGSTIPGPPTTAWPKKLRQLAFLAMSPSGIFFHGGFRGGRKIELCRLGRLRENDAEVINSGTDRKKLESSESYGRCQ